MEITDLLSDAIDSIKSMLDAESVIGAPIVNNEYATVIPITRMSLGFASAGADLEGKNSKYDKELPIGGIGGGANIVPIGFLIINSDKVRFINIEGGADKWDTYLQSFLDLFSK